MAQEQPPTSTKNQAQEHEHATLLDLLAAEGAAKRELARLKNEIRTRRPEVKILAPARRKALDEQAFSAGRMAAEMKAKIIGIEEQLIPYEKALAAAEATLEGCNREAARLEGLFKDLPEAYLFRIRYGADGQPLPKGRPGPLPGRTDADEAQEVGT